MKFTSKYLDPKEYIRVRLEFSESKEQQSKLFPVEGQFLSNVTDALYNFELLYDFLTIIDSDEYENFKFNRFFLYYNIYRALKTEHKIRVHKIIKKSPPIIDVTLLIGTLASIIWVSERIYREYLEIEHLRRENELLGIKIDKERKLGSKLYKSEIQHVLHRLGRRLEKNPIKLKKISEPIEE